MKLSITLSFGALLLLSSAIPLEKRQDVTMTTTIDVIETVEAIVTVWLPPGAKPAPQNLHKQVAQPKQPSPAPVAHTTPVQDAVLPASSSPSAPSSPSTSNTPSASGSPSTSNTPSAASQDSPQAAQDAVNNAQDQANHAQDLKNQAQKAKDLADQQQSIDTQNQINKAQDQTNNAKTAQNQAVPAPVAQPPAAPVNVPAAAPPATQDSSSSGQTQATSGGSCGEIGGSCSASDITFYDGGLGACGWTNDTASEDFFAVAADMMGEASNGSPLCGRTAAIVYQGKTIHGTLTDKCPGCGGQSLDLSRHLFNQMFVESVGRYHNIEWHFTS